MLTKYLLSSPIVRRSGLPLALMARPDRRRRMVRTEQPCGGMERKRQIAERRGVDGGERSHG